MEAYYQDDFPENPNTQNIHSVCSMIVDLHIELKQIFDIEKILQECLLGSEKDISYKNFQ